MKRPHGVILFTMVVLTLVAAGVTAQALVLGDYRVSQGPKRGPPTRVWRFTGSEATRVGWGTLALTAAFGLMSVNIWLTRRGVDRAWRRRVGAALGLLSLSTLLLFPPWQIRGFGILAAFWAFFLPALAGILGRGGGTALGVLVGALLAWAAGRGETMNGLMPGLFAFGFVGGHLSFLLYSGFREWLLNGLSGESRRRSVSGSAS